MDMYLTVAAEAQFYNVALCFPSFRNSLFVKYIELGADSTACDGKDCRSQRAVYRRYSFAC